MREYKPEFLYLTTTGRKSGNPHEIEIWYVPHEGCYYLITEFPDKSDTVKNIRQNASITFLVEGQRHSGTARFIDPQTEPELAAAVRTKMDAKYKWSDGLIVEMKPLQTL